MTAHPLKKPIFAGLAFSLLGMAVAGLLVCKHVFPDFCHSAYGCTIDGVDGCAELGSSKYSKIFGIPIAIPGFFFYATMLGMLGLILREKNGDRSAALVSMLLSLSVFAVVFDLVLGYINFTQLVVPCRLCIYTYFCTAGLFGSVIWMNLMAKKSNPKVLPFSEGVKLSLPAAGVGAAATVALFLFLFTASKVAAKPGAGADLLAPEKVTETLSDFRALSKVDLNTAGLDGVEGEPGAYIVIQKFADFMCPHCYHAGQQLQAAMKRWPGRIRIYYRHFPLDGTCNPLVQRKDPTYGEMRCNGAQAALCGPEQKIFAPLYHGIFELQNNPEGISISNLQNLTEKLGGNWPKMLACMQSPRTNAALQRDIRDAQAIKLNSTPTLLVQDRLLPPGNPDETFFKHLMDALVYEKEGAKAYEEFGSRKQP